LTATKYRYSLEKGSREFHCPACERKRFVRYIDNETGNYLPDDIGRCERVNSCGYHKKPREAAGFDYKPSYFAPKPVKPLKPSTLPYSMVEATLNRYDRNQLVQWMATLPGWDISRAMAAASHYKLGTGSRGVAGWPIFWLIDESGKVRSGKTIRYENGHRAKDGYSYDWIHTILSRSGFFGREEFELVQCFYGVGIVDSTKPIAIVESEKTAIIASQYLPQFHWLAAGMKHGINEYKLRPLRGRQITLFPDIDALEFWTEKAKEFSGMATIQVSDLLNRKAPGDHHDQDLADYLIRHDVNEFLSEIAPHGFNQWTMEIFDERGHPADW